MSLDASAVLAHGIGAIQDLPVPAWLFYYGAALVLVASFVALGAVEGAPLERARERLLPRGCNVLLSPVLRVVLGAISVALLALVVAAALVGEDSPTLNLAPTFVYVVFWLGMPLLSVLLGDVWRVLNLCAQRGRRRIRDRSTRRSLAPALHLSGAARGLARSCFPDRLRRARARVHDA